MAPGFILWVSWVLLFRSDIVSTTEGSFRVSHPTRNLLDDGESHLSFDEGNKEAEATHNPNSVVYASYNLPSKEPVNVGPTGQRLPEMQSSIHLEKMINAGSNWEPNFFNPMTFPLNHGIQVADQTQSKLQIVLPPSKPLNAFPNVKPSPQRPSEASSAIQMTNLKPNHPLASWSVVSSSLQSKQPVSYGSDKNVPPVHYQSPDKGSSQTKTASDKSQSLVIEGASNYNIGSGQMQPKQALAHSQSSPTDLETRREDPLRRGETSHTINRINLKPGPLSASWSGVSPSLQSMQPVTPVSEKATPPVKYLKISSSKGKIGTSPLWERASNYNTGSSHVVAQMQPKPVNPQSKLQDDHTRREVVPPSQRGTSYAIKKNPLQPSHISMIPPGYQSKVPLTSGSDKGVLPSQYQKPSSSQSGISLGNYSTDTGSNLLVGLTQQKQPIALAQSNPLDPPTSPGSFFSNLSGMDSGSPATDLKSRYTSNSWSMASSSIPFEKPLVFRSDPAASLSHYQRLDAGSSPSRTSTGKTSAPLFEGAYNYNTNTGSSHMVGPIQNNPNLFQLYSRTQDTYPKNFVSPSFDQSPMKHDKPSFFSQSPPVATSDLEVKLPVSARPEAPVSPTKYQKSQYGSNQHRSGLVQNPNLFAGPGFYNSRNHGTLSALDHKPMPAEPSQKYASLETESWYGQGNDIDGSNTNLLPQRKPPKKMSSDIPESQGYIQSNLIAAGPSTAFASPMWAATHQSTGTQARKDWPFPASGVFDNWNLEFPQVNYQTQNSVAKVQKYPSEKVVQPASGAVPGKRRIVHSKNGYKRERLALSKAAYDPKYEIPPAKDAMAVNPFKRLPPYRQPVFKF